MIPEAHISPSHLSERMAAGKGVWCMLFFLILSLTAIAQRELLTNPSFEAGVADIFEKEFFTMKGWRDWGSHVMFPGNSPPDIHTSNTNWWSVKRQSQHGRSFVGLVTRPDGSFESLAQRLKEPLIAGLPYILTIYVSQDSIYLSPWRLYGYQQINFVNPTVLRIWGSNTAGQMEELLAESQPVDHYEWRQYVFQFIPKDRYKFLVISARSPAGETDKMTGHILIDNASLHK